MGAMLSDKITGALQRPIAGDVPASHIGDDRSRKIPADDSLARYPPDARGDFMDRCH
jgi:hypothetical protein